MGVLSGPYGPGEVVRINPYDATWSEFGKLPKDGRESVSVLQRIGRKPGDRRGVNAWTEHPNGSRCYVAWEDQDWVWQLVQEFPGFPWALGGTMVSYGWVSLNEGRPNRENGGWIADWDAWGGDAWEAITPAIKDHIIWDALPWKDGKLLACSIGHGQYLTEDAGRLKFEKNGQVEDIPLPQTAGGILRLYHWPDWWPERIWITTTWGEVWFRENDDWTLFHDHDIKRQNNSFLFNLDGLLVLATAQGAIWIDGQLMAEIEGVEFMSLASVRTDEGWRLVGVISFKGDLRSRPVAFLVEE